MSSRKKSFFFQNLLSATNTHKHPSACPLDFSNSDIRTEEERRPNQESDRNIQVVHALLGKVLGLGGASSLVLGMAFWKKKSKTDFQSPFLGFLVLESQFLTNFHSEQSKQLEQPESGSNSERLGFLTKIGHSVPKTSRFGL